MAATEGFAADFAGAAPEGFTADFTTASTVAATDSFAACFTADFAVAPSEDFAPASADGFEDDESDPDVLPDDEAADFDELLSPLPLDLLDFSVADLTVFSAADVIFLTGLLSAWAMPVANPSRRNPTTSPRRRTRRRAATRQQRARPRERRCARMAMRSPPWSPATDGCCPART